MTNTSAALNDPWIGCTAIHPIILSDLHVYPLPKHALTFKHKKQCARGTVRNSIFVIAWGPIALMGALKKEKPMHEYLGYAVKCFLSWHSNVILPHEGDTWYLNHYHLTCLIRS